MADQQGAELAAMRRALEIAADPAAPLGPNPRVGCVLLSPDGRVVAEGFHRGAGMPHAEVEALTSAGGLAHGTTAVVTLEPCNHTGLTGPCSEALIEARVARVVVAQRDPNPLAQGGTGALRAAGIEVVHGVLEEEAATLNRAWTFGIRHGRPLVTWKFATTLDGRSAAADGTSRWVSNTASRRDTHRLRRECDVMLVGTATVEVDDPRLTVRDEADHDLPHQPLRVVMGMRDLDPDRRVLDDTAPTRHIRSQDPAKVLAELFSLGKRHVFLEGGPTLAAAFLTAGLVDEVVAYVAPTFLGAGVPSVADLGVTTMGDAITLRLDDVTVLPGGDDEPANLRLDLTPGRNH